VDDGVVGAGSKGIGVERKPAAPIVEGVEHDPEVIVLPQLIRVAPQLVRDPFVGRARVPASARDVHVLGVVHHPHVGPLGRLGTVDRHHLQQAAEELLDLVDLVVEPAVHGKRFGELDRANGHATARVAGDDVGGHRRR
jgi:hypothetical protein